MSPPADALQAVVHPCPWPYYRSLVNGPELLYDERLRLWVAAGAAAVSRVLEHPAMRVRPLAEPVPGTLAGAAAGEIFARLMRMNEGRPHTAPKAVLQRVLASTDKSHIRARALAVAASVPLDAGRAACLNRWAFQVPVSVTADLLGFPAAEQPQVTAWVADFVACLSPLSTPAQLAAASVAAQELLERFRRLVSDCAAGQGSIVGLVQAEAAAAGWDDAGAILANLVGLLSQTYEATAGLVGNSIVALATHAGLQREVAGSPELVAHMVEEVGRHDPPTHNTRRFAAQDLTLCGQELSAGDAVLLVLAAANRDPQLNPDPDEFRLHRTQRRTLGFGHGRHACPGQHLAQAIAASAIEVLLAARPALEAGKIAWTYRPSANGHLPVFHDITGAAQ